jgi:hypothetical protein
VLCAGSVVLHTVVKVLCCALSAHLTSSVHDAVTVEGVECVCELPDVDG